MNHRHVTIAADLVNGNAFSVNLNVPWPSIMTVRQIDYRYDGTDIGAYLIWSNFTPDDGILGAFHDGTSVAPQSKFHIQKALLGSFSVKILDPDLNPAPALHGYLIVKLEFEPAVEKVESKINH